MKIRSKVNILTFSIMVSAFFVACERQEDLNFADFDRNGDGLIQQIEFTEVFTIHYYDDWNLEDDEYLDDEDFYSSVFKVWDENSDDVLSREEWTGGYDYYYGNYVVVVDYEEVDRDQSGQVSIEEYNDWAFGTSFYNDWDTDKDKNLSEAELARGLFNIWDTDNSGTIEKDEFKEFESTYLDI